VPALSGYRKYLNHTLVLGWWGIYSVTPIYTFQNTFEYLKARKALAVAQVHAGGQIRPS